MALGKHFAQFAESRAVLVCLDPRHKIDVPHHLILCFKHGPINGQAAFQCKTGQSLAILVVGHARSVCNVSKADFLPELHCEQIWSFQLETTIQFIYVYVCSAAENDIELLEVSVSTGDTSLSSDANSVMFLEACSCCVEKPCFQRLVVGCNKVNDDVD